MWLEASRQRRQQQEGPQSEKENHCIVDLGFDIAIQSTRMEPRVQWPIIIFRCDVDRASATTKD